MKELMYAHLIELIQLYEANRKNCEGRLSCLYFAGGIEALKRLKDKYDSL